MEARRDSLQARVRDQQGWQGRISAVDTLLHRIQDRIEEADDDTKREMMTTLVQGITIGAGEDSQPEVTVTYLFEPSGGLVDITPSAKQRANSPG